MKGSWVRKIALLIGSTGTVLIAAEVFVRSWFDGKFGARPACFGPDPETIYRPTPNLAHVFYGEDYSAEIRTDEYGCRLGALGPVPDDKDLVLLCGDSNAFGWGVSTEETCASHLDELIDEHSGHTARVINLGVSGYGTIQSALRLAQFFRERPGARERTRALVFIHCENDVTDNTNLRSIAILVGAKTTFPKAPRNRWPSHLANLLVELGRPPEKSDDAKADVGATFGFGVRDVRRMPATFVLGQTSFRLDDFTPADSSFEPKTRREFTAMQRALIAEGLDALHRAVADANICIYHTLIRVPAACYAREMRSLIDAAPGHGNTIVNVGWLPKNLTFRGEVLNRHKGGHFNARYNEDWARSLYKMLRDRDPNLSLR